MSEFVINAQKMVDLIQVEIEADTEEEAVAEYLAMVQRDEIGVSDFRWNDLSAGDLDIEAH